MAIKYKLVSRKNLGKDQEVNPEKMYAHMPPSDLVLFEDVIEEVSDSSGVGSASVKAVVDRMNVVLIRHLKNGRRVCMGDLGIFRFTFGSEGVADMKSFDTGMIREPRVCFFPGKALRIAKSRVSFERLVQPTNDTEGGNQGGENPDENPDIL